MHISNRDGEIKRKKDKKIWLKSKVDVILQG